MKTKRVAKSALFTSVLALVLCVSMLVGTTFAWFTDSVTSGNNIIAAGNLDVELVHTNAKVKEAVTVADATDLFLDLNGNEILWEPGVVSYENLTVKNVGTLALKYQLGINFSDTNKLDGHGLSEALKVGVVEGGVKGTTREAVVGEVAQWQDLTSFNLTGELTAGQTAEEDFGLVIYWQPGENDNLYNANNGKETSDKQPLNINLGIILTATQLTHEFDSFDDQYDAGSTYPEISVPVYGADNVNDAISNGGSVVMGDDVTGEGKVTGPYNDTTAGLEQNGGTLDGNGNELDVNATYGIITSGGTIKNLVIDKTGVERGILINTPTEDVIIDNVTIDGPGYAINTAEAGADNVAVYVKNSTVNGWASFGTAVDKVNFSNTKLGYNTDEYWQDMGYDADYDRLVKPYVTTVFENCTFEKDYYVDLSSLAAGETVTFINCTCEGTVLTADNYSNYIVIENYNKNSVFFPVEIAEGVLEAGARNYYIRTAEGLQNVFAEVIPQNREQSQSVNLMNDIDLSGIIWEPIDNMHFTFNGNGYTISNVTCKEGWRSGFFGYAGGVIVNDLTLENVTASGSQVGTFAGSAEGLRTNNCYLKGDNTVNYYETDETWGGIGAITGVISGSTVNVEICDGATVSVNKNDITTNCTYYDDLTGYLSANNGTVVNNGTLKVAVNVEDQTSLDEALAAGADTVVLSSGTYVIPDTAKGQTLTIIGNGETVLEAQDDGAAEGDCDYSFEGATVTFENVTIATKGGNYPGYVRMNATYNKCTIKGTYTLYGESTFNECTFDLNNGYVWTWGAPKVTFNSCTFEDSQGMAKAILVHNTVNTEVTVKDCEFIATTAANTWDGILVAAVSIDPAAAVTATVNFTGTNTYSDVFNGLYQLKYAAEKDLVTVTVDGASVDVPVMK